jgi:hypothetical protein
MQPDTITSQPLDEFNDLNRKIRKIENDKKETDYEKYKQNLEKKIYEIDSHDMMETMKNERRDWIKQRMIGDEKGEPPKKLREFYQRNDVAPREEEDDAKKKAKEQIAKDKLKKEQDKKKKDEQGQFTRGK